eukprot:SAG11_NODE_2625_length_3164_cov_3.186623_2_plen_88_part_00
MQNVVIGSSPELHAKVKAGDGDVRRKSPWCGLRWRLHVEKRVASASRWRRGWRAHRVCACANRTESERHLGHWKMPLVGADLATSAL